MTSAAKVPARVSSRAAAPLPRVRMGFGYQLRAVAPVVMYGLLLLAVTLALVWLPEHARVAADPSPIVQALLGAQLFRIELWLAPLLLLCGSIAAIVALVRAKRVAVSMEQLRETLAKLAVGDAEPLSFPASSEFRQFEAPASGIGKRIEQLTRGNLEVLRVLRHNLEGLEQRTASGTAHTELRESIRVLIRDVDAEIKKLQMKS